MADFKALLTDLNQGKTDLDKVRGWIDEAMMTGAADPHDLLRQLDDSGLGADASDSLRTHLRTYAPDAGGAPAFDFDLSLDLPDTPAPSAPPAAPAAIGGDMDLSLELDPLPDPDKTVAMPSGSEDRTVAMGQDPDKTVAMGQDNDRTVAMGQPDNDRTVQMGGDDRTVKTGTPGGDGDFDPFAVDSERTAPTGGPPTGGHPTGGSWPTGTAWPGAAQGKPLEIGPGAILKDRFELVSPLGEGGMGVVYKARDLLKVEAKDRNPYVAVKLLTGDFKQHPEAFIALQRESSKAQRLAHPNIATVFDFDRDRGTVYMTMEVMDGQELAKYIKKLPAGGLPVEEALRITKQMCDGLSYAHQRGLVHSDFKPGNCFILQDGSVKIMDFGIARASKTKGDAEGESTVFDPGQLGALTPAYATVEMFEGEDPAPPDDIYALAITTYELLTGKHPFNKLSAVKVLEKGLTPAPVVKPGWTKRQNRGLMKAMALKRPDRTQSVEQFWEDIRPKKDYTLQIVGGSVAAAIVFGLLLYKPIKETLEDSRNNQIIQNVIAGKEAAVPDALAQLDAFADDDRSRRMVLENEEAKKIFLNYFENLAQSEINEEEGKFNYAKALSILQDAGDKYYPDSAALGALRTDIDADKNSLVLRLDSEYKNFLETGQGFLPAEGRDLTDVLATLKAVDPAANQFKDPSVPNRYTTIIQQLARGEDWKRASDILKLSLGFYPQHPGLLGLRDQVERELKREQDNQLVSDIKQRLAALRGKTGDLANFTESRADLLKLNELRPEDPLLGELSTALRTVVASTLDKHIAAKQWEPAEKVLVDYAQLLTVPELLKKREDLSRAEIGASWQPPNVGETVSRLDGLQKGMRDLLAKPTFEAEWDAKLLSQYKDAIAALRPGNTWFDGLRKDILDAYVGQAQKAVAESRFDTAARLLDTGERFQPGLAVFQTTRDALAQARVKYDAEQAEAEKLAKIESDKNSVKLAADAKNSQLARSAYENLKARLGADDAWVKGAGADMLGTMYKEIAEGAMKDRPEIAMNAVNDGLAIAPGMKELQAMRASLAGASTKLKAFDAAARATTADLRALPGLIAAARQALPNEANAIQAEAMKRLADQIKRLESRDVVEANDLWNQAKELFPNTQALTSLSLRAPPRESVYGPRIRTEVAAGKLTAARVLLAEGKQREPGHDAVAAAEALLREAEQKANQSYGQYMSSKSTNKTAARTFLDAARKIWNDNPTFEDEFKANYQVTTAPVKAADGSRPCTATLAGYGKQARAECFDMPGGQRGPTLVVVPAGGGSSTPFAIGKYEVSVGEYNAVCRATSACPPASGDATLPVTGISLNAAKGFIDALSQATGKQYRLPTDAEWTHAANGTNPAEVKDFNCRVQQGDQVLKGISMLAIRTGTSNAWGVTNYVGNAQEFVAKGAGAAVRGGAFSDSLSTCSIALEKPTNGAADPLTGFRVARNID